MVDEARGGERGELGFASTVGSRGHRELVECSTRWRELKDYTVEERDENGLMNQIAFVDSNSSEGDWRIVRFAFFWGGVDGDGYYLFRCVSVFDDSLE